MTSSPDEDQGAAVPQTGYGRPPAATRFRKGQSGNPKGRPRNRRREIPYDTVLGQMVTVREDGTERRITAAEAFLLQLTRKGLQGDSSAARASLQAIERARQNVPPVESDIRVIRMVLTGFGIGPTIGRLGLGIKRHPGNEKLARWELNTWIIEAALARLGDRRLTIAEQSEVVSVARKPAEVRWPEWWSVRPWMTQR